MKKIEISDVIVALGILGAGGAAYYFLTRKEDSSKEASPLSPAVRSAIDGSMREIRQVSALMPAPTPDSSSPLYGHPPIPESYFSKPSIFDVFDLGGKSKKLGLIEPGESVEYDREFFPAEFYKEDPRDVSKIRFITLHSTESTNGKARDMAKYFHKLPEYLQKRPDLYKSAHVIVGEDGIYRSVDDDHDAYAVGPKDGITLSVEICGAAKWKEDQWMERKKTLDNAARVIADWSAKYKIPIVPLRADELKVPGNRGVTTHLQQSVAFMPGGKGNGDPGAGFPLGYVMARAQEFLSEKSGSPTKDNPNPVSDQLLADLLGQTTSMLPKS